ncbi:sulfurtransferase [Nigerium massiliense]|uniref:sulfurtransferase n=1 Tax=Nigerium massiliense TaxID=1522317 RepID=UPI00058D6860|nr:sulfurtransferase [Nigerium massiliense]
MVPPVVSASWLTDHPDAVVADVRYYFDGRSGRDAYVHGHLPGAAFIDLAADLAGPSDPRMGRFPLPTPQVFAEAMRRAGISNDSTVVAYDDAGGMFAARLVWMLRMIGVDAAVLDGGIEAYDGPLQSGVLEGVQPGDFSIRPWQPADLATIDDAAQQDLVLDARPTTAYTGEDDPDARSGHIPGAVSAPASQNLASGRFRAPQELAERFEKLGVDDASRVVSYCGGGISACHNLVAMEYAGLGRGRLYPGSWSQYVNTERPVATGAEPGERPRPLTPNDPS